MPRELQVRHHSGGGASSLQWVWELGYEAERDFVTLGVLTHSVEHGRRRFRMRETAGVVVGDRLETGDGTALRVLEVGMARGRFVIVEVGE